MKMDPETMKFLLSERKARQGFSIEELQAGEHSDDDSDLDEDRESENDVEAEVEDDEDEVIVESLEVELADDAADVKNELWVQQHFEQGHHNGDKVVICCPSCFVPVSYVSYPTSNHWEAKKVVNCVVTSTTRQGDTLSCAECGTQVGQRLVRDGKFVFRNVLPSTTTHEQL